MSIPVVYRNGVQLDVARCAASLTDNHPDRRRLADVYLLAAINRLRECDGRQPEAEPVSGVRPPAFRWQFYPGWWMWYVVQTTRQWLFWRRGRVVIYGLDPEAPTARRA